MAPEIWSLPRQVKLEKNRALWVGGPALRAALEIY